MRVFYLLLAIGCECYLAGQIRLPGKRTQPPQQQEKPEQTSGAKTVDVTGVVNSTDDRSLTIMASDSRFLTFKVVPATKFNDGLAMANIKPGEHVRITGKQDDEAFLTATGVYIDDTAAPPAETKAGDDKAPDNGNTVMKSAAPDPEDGGRPHLKYGKPDEKKVSSATPPVQYDETPYVPPTLADVEPVKVSVKSSDPKKELVERAREAALNFTTALPNYFCQQFTTRYMREPGSSGWRAKDIVSATVVFEDGKEDYRDIKINGKGISKKMEEMQGAWSTGEFGTTLRSLFHPGRRAEFHFSKQVQISGATAYVYDYQVSRQNSDWHIILGSQSIMPAYSGRVWIDSKTGRTLRMEKHADDVPAEFPLDTIEATDDYGLVRLSSGTQEFLLPTHAENLSCERGTTICSRNTIEFRNYRKYAGETVLTFDKQE